jgi:circadian clock protein KaiB
MAHRRIKRRIRKKWSPMMKAGKRKRPKTTKPGGEIYVFLLFVAGNESNSAQARGNLAPLCEKHLQGRYQIEIVDVLKDASTAHKNNVLVTPTLILIEPPPKVTLLGNLNDIRQVLAALRLAR